MRLNVLLPALRKHGVTMYRFTDTDGTVTELHLGPLPPAAEGKASKKAEKAAETTPELPVEEKYPKDAAVLAFKLAGGR